MGSMNYRNDVLEVNTIEVILLDKTHHSIHESGTVVSRTNSSGEVLRAGPTTNGEHRFGTLGSQALVSDSLAYEAWFSLTALWAASTN